MALDPNDICDHGNVLSQCDVCFDLPERLKAAAEKARLDAIQAEKDRVEKERIRNERVGSVRCFFKDTPENFKPKPKKLWVKNILIFRNKNFWDAVYNARMYIAGEFPEANALVETTVQTLVVTDVSGGGGGGYVSAQHGGGISTSPVTSSTNFLYEIKGFPALVDEKHISALFEQEP
ncbi:MAG: hypothetical protein ACYDBP_03170 [Leptospirales bacterium]